MKDKLIARITDKCVAELRAFRNALDLGGDAKYVICIDRRWPYEEHINEGGIGFGIYADNVRKSATCAYLVDLGEFSVLLNMPENELHLLEAGILILDNRTSMVVASICLTPQEKYSGDQGGVASYLASWIQYS